MAGIAIMAVVAIGCLALLGVTIYEHATAISLSLPISPGLTGMAIALPVLAVLNAAYLRLHTHQQQQEQRRRQRTKALPASSSAGTPLPNPQTAPTTTTLQLLFHPAALQILQGILTVALATLLATDLGAPSSPTLRCALETTWQRLYSAHDADAIRRVQDALRCCGFNSVADRAWPFPAGGGNPKPSTCAQSYGRDTPCRAPWAAALQRGAGADFAVVLVVGLFQITSVLLSMRSSARGARGATSSQQQQQQHGRPGWMRSLFGGSPRPRRFADDDDEHYHDDGREEGEEEEEEEVEPGRRPLLPALESRTPYSDDGHGTGEGRPRRAAGGGENGRGHGYDHGHGHGPRLEPSTLGAVGNEWDDE